MKTPLFIPFNTRDEYVSGPRTFLMNLEKGLRNDFPDFSFTSCGLMSPWCWGMFFPIEYSLKTVKMMRALGKHVIQRLDGVHYLEKNGEKWRELNRPVENIYKNYATAVVYQSHYAKRQIEHVIGLRNDIPSTIVMNGADPDFFYPGNRTSLGINGKIRFITTGYFRHNSQIAPLVHALDLLKGYDFEFLIVGEVLTSVNFSYQRPYVRHLKTENAKELGDLLRSADVFLYSHLNPPCPNSVIEAVTTGLPVVSFDTGAMGEICYFSKDLLVDMPGGPIHLERDLDPDGLVEKIKLVLDPKINRQSHSSDFLVTRMVENYKTFFTQLHNS